MKVRVITTPNDSSPYIIRLTLLSLFGYSIYLHIILRSDDDRALHDHPWPFVSIILAGGYWEYTKEVIESGRPILGWKRPGSILFRRATDTHRIEVSEPAVSLVFTGRRWRKWGFWCPQGWVHWRKFDQMAGCGDDSLAEEANG